MGLNFGGDLILKLTVPVPPSGNRMWRHTRQGKVYKTDEAKSYQLSVAYVAKVAAREQGWSLTQGQKVRMKIWYYWPDNRNRDTDNARKVLCDAFQNVIYDNDRYVLANDMDWQVDRKNPRLEIEFELNS